MTILIKDIAKHVGEEVEIKGWLYNKRSSGPLSFLELRDGHGWVQGVVVKKEVSEEVWKSAEDVTQESSLVVVGKVSKHPKKENVFELQVTSYKLYANSSNYPIAHKEHGPDFLLDNRHLWIRTPTQWAVLRMRHLVKAGLQDYFNSNGFVELDTPTFTPNACEGTTDLFKVDYFGEPAYLSQNGQLYLEALSSAFGKVYDLCPNFRAEKSKTRKHLIEFWTLNPEMAFIEHEESLQIQEAAIKHLVKYVLEHGQAELKILERSIDDLKSIVEKPFKHYLYSEAIEELQKRGSAIKYGDDLGAEDEVLLTENSDVPVVVKNWPKTIKPFYMKADPANELLALNADVLASKGFGEIIGGSQREDDYEVVLANIKKHNLNVADFEWYLDLRRYGSVPHCGFGIGIERVTRWLAGIHHIRETAPFPRMLNRLRP